MGSVTVIVNLAIAPYKELVIDSVLEFPLLYFTISSSDQCLLLVSWRQVKIAKVCVWKIKPIHFCISAIGAVYACACPFSFHFCPGCPRTVTVFWGGGSRRVWSGEEWSKAPVVTVPFLPQTFRVNNFIASMFWGSFSCCHSLWDVWVLVFEMGTWTS